MTPFGRFTASRAVAWAGNSLTLLALPVLLYQRTADPLLTGLLAACGGLPYLVLGLPAGALVDRWGARPTMLVTTALSAVAMASVPVAEWAGVLTTAHLLLAALVTSTLFVFFDAGSFGAVPALVGREDLGPATARLAGVSTAIGLVGPALAGVLLTVAPPGRLLALDAAGYGVSLLLLSTVRWTSTTAAGHGVLADVVAGLRRVWDHHVVRVLTLIGIGGSLAGGVVTGLLVVLADQRFGLAAGDVRLGLLYSAGPAGAVLSAVLVPGLQRRVPVGRLSLLTWGAATGALGVLALAGTWWAAAGALFAWQTGSTTAILNAIVVRQTVTPAEFQSRVGTTARMIAFSGQPLGAAAGGAVAATAGLGAALGLAVLCCAGAVVGGWAGGLGRVPVLAALPRPSAQETARSG